MVGCYMRKLAQIRFCCRVCEDEQSDNIINHHIISDFVVAAQIQGITNMAIICELIDCKDRHDVFQAGWSTNDREDRTTRLL